MHVAKGRGSAKCVQLCAGGMGVLALRTHAFWPSESVELISVVGWLR